MSQGRTSHEFSGAKPKQRAIAILDTYDEDIIDNIKIEIVESYDDTPTESQTEKDTEGNNHTKEASKEEVDSKSEEEDVEERYLGSISSGTNHQKVLYAVQKLDHEAPVEATRVEEWIGENLDDDLKRGSIFGALHDLYERCLIDRQKNDQHNNEYQITVHGDDQMQKVGEP